MSSEVPFTCPDNDMYYAPYDVRSAKPVKASYWNDLGKTMNWVLGHGLVMVAGHCPSHATVVAGSNETFHYMMYQPEVSDYSIYTTHMWIIRISGELAGVKQGSSGTITIDDGEDDEVAGSWSVTSGVSQNIVIYQPLTNHIPTFNDRPATVKFECAAGSLTDAYIEQIMCVALPRATLNNPLAEMGCDTITLQPRRGIYAPVSANNPTKSSVKALHAADHIALRYTNRCLFSWSGAEHVETATSYTNMFNHSPEMVARYLYSGRTDRYVRLYLYAKADAGGVGGNVKFTSNATSDDTVMTVTNTSYAWASASLNVGIDNLAEEDNRRAADETVDIECCANSGGEVYVKGIALYETLVAFG